MGQANDPVVRKVKRLVKSVATKYGVEVLSIVLYGSRVRGGHTLNSDYDFFILLNDGTTLLQFTQFNAELRLKLSQLGDIKLYANTFNNFKYIMKNNAFLGPFCYIIISEGLSIYDPRGVFKGLKAQVESLDTASKMQFVKKCAAMSKKLGSFKWFEYWNEKLKSLTSSSTQ